MRLSICTRIGVCLWTFSLYINWLLLADCWHDVGKNSKINGVVVVVAGAGARAAAVVAAAAFAFAAKQTAVFCFKDHERVHENSTHTHTRTRKKNFYTHFIQVPEKKKRR